jgi:hypothetical protein
MQLLWFPQLSVAFHVREITWLPGQLPGVLTSLYVITGEGSQLSVAKADPVLEGRVEF